MRRLSRMLAVAVVFAVVSSGSAVTAAVPSGPPQAFSMLGMANVGGEAVIVDVVVAVRPGQNAADVARAALRQQGARPLDSAEFETTGLVWDQFSDGNPGNDFVTQNYNPANEPVAGGPALVSSQGTWTSVSTATFAFSDGETTNRCPSLVRECKGPQFFDGNNDVAWLELSGCCTLGVTWFSTGTDEADMALNLDFDWATDGDHFDVETVFLHENGHVVGLGHSAVQQATMYASYQEVRRVLHQDDIDGITSLYPAIVDNPPTVSVTSPAAGATLSGTTVTVSATATDDNGVTQVEFFVDGASIGVDTTDPYAVSWDTTTVADGARTVSATATDTANQTTSNSIDVTVDNVDDPPTVTITSPANGATVSGTIDVTADASDDNGVTQVEFFVDGASIGVDTTDPYAVSWDTTTVADGARTVSATATDTANQTASDSVDVTVDNTAPTVSISSPLDGVPISGTIGVTADAADATSGVTQVEFFVDGASIGVDTTAPYAVSWDTNTATNGSHALTATATDGAGNATTSVSVTVAVDNPVVATMHVGDLDGQGVKLNKGNWHALVTVTVHDGGEDVLSGATVSGTFSQNGTTIPGSCTTGGSGTCTIDSGQFPSKGGNATFTVVNVTSTLTYQAADNHDPDGDSNGTSIALSK